MQIAGVTAPQEVREQEFSPTLPLRIPVRGPGDVHCFKQHRPPMYWAIMGPYLALGLAWGIAPLVRPRRHSRPVPLEIAG